MSKLNLDSFNEILFGALKDNSTEGKIKMLEAELGMVANIFYSEVAVLLDELEQTNYQSDQFQKILNIKSNSESLLEQLEQLKGAEE